MVVFLQLQFAFYTRSFKFVICVTHLLKWCGQGIQAFEQVQITEVSLVQAIQIASRIIW